MSSVLTAADLPKPRMPGPTTQATMTGETGRSVLTVKGARFEPAKTLQVFLNDQLMQTAAIAGRDGGFKFDVPVPPYPGEYRLTVRQAGDHGPLAASAYYDIGQPEGPDSLEMKEGRR